MLKAKAVLKFKRIVFREKEYRFPAKATVDYNALAGEGAGAAGEFAAKETIKYFIPVMGTVFFLMDCKKAIVYVQSDKELTLPPGTMMIVESTGMAMVPVRRYSTARHTVGASQGRKFPPKTRKALSAPVPRNQGCSQMPYGRTHESWVCR
jgi:hypothetical protein